MQAICIFQTDCFRLPVWEREPRVYFLLQTVSTAAGGTPADVQPLKANKDACTNGLGSSPQANEQSESCSPTAVAPSSVEYLASASSSSAEIIEAQDTAAAVRNQLVQSATDLRLPSAFIGQTAATDAESMESKRRKADSPEVHDCLQPGESSQQQQVEPLDTNDPGLVEEQHSVFREAFQNFKGRAKKIDDFLQACSQVADTSSRKVWHRCKHLLQ